MRHTRGTVRSRHLADFCWRIDGRYTDGGSVNPAVLSVSPIAACHVARLLCFHSNNSPTILRSCSERREVPESAGVKIVEYHIGALLQE
jgi:hypothetical protein